VDGGKLKDESDELQVDLLTSLRRLIVAPNASWGNIREKTPCAIRKNFCTMRAILHHIV
jgi:hypothetical protein